MLLRPKPLSSSKSPENTVTWSNLLLGSIVVGGLLGFCVGLAQAISYFESVYDHRLFAAVAFHLPIALATWFFIQRGQLKPEALPIECGKWTSPQLCVGAALLVIGGAIIGGVVGGMILGFDGSIRLFSDPSRWVLIIVIVPILEETVYRGWLGVTLTKYLGGFNGSLWGAAAFSFMHTLPTIDRIGSGEAGLVPGPFMLAVVCDLFYRGTGKLRYPTLFHAACNSTVLIFQFFQPKIVNYFPIFYS